MVVSERAEWYLQIRISLSEREVAMGEPQRVHFFLVAMAVVLLGACSSEPRDKQAQKSAAAPDRIQGKIQVLAQAFGSADASVNEGSPVVYLWQGVRRYTLAKRSCDTERGEGRAQCTATLVHRGGRRPDRLGCFKRDSPVRAGSWRQVGRHDRSNH
jgi:hypothetical protein